MQTEQTPKVPARILIIEDSADYRQIITYYLRASGFTVIDVGDGRQGLEKARVEKCDLVVTDLMLPGLSGYEICTLLKQDLRYQKVPIMVLTASKLLPKDEQLAKQCGADAFVPKSLEPRQLIEKIQELLAASGSSTPSIGGKA